jgi:acyl-CoA dehydrogenase
MPTYKAPVEDVLFLLTDVLCVERFNNVPGFGEVNEELASAIVSEAGRVCADVLQPLNQIGDREGCIRHPNGDVTTPPGFKEAYRAFVEAGWVGLSADPAYGGQGLPYLFAAIVNEFASAANIAFAMYPGLTQGAFAAILTHGSEEQKKTYVPKMISGAWSGTMNLTEPHCGTDLGLLKTKAIPNDDGSYAIHGQKIFISAGEHDLTENIIHLVLARIQGAPAGVKGISLFIVPKFLVEADQTLGPRNALSCGSIEHKMGIHGNATCVMNYDGAKGFLIGEANKGLNAMFVMMNEARLGVAVQGLGQSEVAYQNAAAYAKDRKQGRALSAPKDSIEPQPIIVHPDIRRILLTIRGFNEAARALLLSAALDADIAHRSEDEAARQAASDRLGLLTPVLKGVLTDIGFDNTVLAQQVFGGHGYIGEWGMEQFVRDARIAMIYEGANGIQALDLVGRKLAKDNGRAIMAFFAEVSAFIKDNAAEPELKPFLGPLEQAAEHLRDATLWFMQNALVKPEQAAAGAYDYMHLFGLVGLGYMWARIAKAALARKARKDAAQAAMDFKLLTGRFFMERIIPESVTRLARIRAGAEAMMAPSEEMF